MVGYFKDAHYFTSKGGKSQTFLALGVRPRIGGLGNQRGVWYDRPRKETLYLMIQSTDHFINQLVRHRVKTTAKQLTAIVERVIEAEFIEALIEVEEPLWGSFWQFDVIAPGYQLPAIEVALLRAMRLDWSWPEETTVAQFLTDVRQALRQPQVGIWTLEAAGEPMVVVAGQNDGSSLTVAWYCATTGRLHAAYRTAPASFSKLKPPGAVEQNGLPLVIKAKPKDSNRIDWLTAVIAEKQDNLSQDLASRLDAAILTLREGYF